MGGKKRRKKRSARKVAGLLVCLAVLGGALWLSLVFAEFQNGEDRQGKMVAVEIEKGEGISQIGDKLKEKGLIRHKLAFYLKVKTMNMAGKLKYGSFELQKGSSLGTLIRELAEGSAKQQENWFTVPEGFTIEKIAKKLSDEGFCSGEEFLAAVQQEYDYWFLDSVPEDAQVDYRLQGFLFPDTYEIGADMTAEDIVRTMLDQFGAQYTEQMDAQAKKLGKTTYEIVTEASIIERETDREEERAMIAGVIENRLKAGMPLQMCPTVLYPITKGMYDVTTVTYEDTKVDSPYNTYQNKGLPPGPIANPGLACLEAALNPASHKYFFYHTDEEKNDGSHIFTETYEEHIKTQGK